MKFDMLDRLFHRHLEEDEPLYIVIHKHWILGLTYLWKPILCLVATLITLYFLPIKYILIAVALVDCGILVWLLRNFFDYYLDAWIITDRSVIDVEWHGWFHRQSTRIDYTSIEGVSYEIEGVFGTLLRYGTVSIEKIGSGSVVSICDVKNPRDIESIILACQDAHVRKKNLKDTNAVKDILAEIVADRMMMQEDDEEDEEIEDDEYEDDEV